MKKYQQAMALLERCLPYVSMVRMQGSIGAEDLLLELLAFGVKKPGKITMKKAT